MPENGLISIGEIFNTIAKELGGEIYEIDIKKINPQQSVRLKCLVPLCEYYGVCKICPPYIPSVAEFKEALEDYTKAFIVLYQEEIDNLEKYRTNFRAEMKLAEIVSALELASFKHGSYQALGLCVGGCKLCPECTPPGEPCRHPFKSRPSPEGFGIDITKLAREAGISVEWPPQKYVNFLGLVLV